MDYDVLGLKVGLHFDEKTSMRNLQNKINDLQKSFNKGLNIQVGGVDQAIGDLNKLTTSMTNLSTVLGNAFTNIDMTGLSKVMETINKIDSGAFKKGGGVFQGNVDSETAQLQSYQKALEIIDKQLQKISASASKFDTGFKSVPKLMAQIEKVGDFRKNLSNDEVDNKGLLKYESLITKLQSSYEGVIAKQEKSKIMEKELISTQNEHFALLKRMDALSDGSNLYKEYERQAEQLKEKIKSIKEVIRGEGLTTDAIKLSNAEYSRKIDNLNKIAKAKISDEKEAEKQKKEAEALKIVEQRVKAVSTAYEKFKTQLSAVDDKLKTNTGVNRAISDLEKMNTKLQQATPGEVQTKTLNQADKLLETMASKYEILTQKQSASKAVYNSINEELQKQLRLIGELSTRGGDSVKGVYAGRLEESRALVETLKQQATENGLVTAEMQKQILISERLIAGAEELRQAKLNDANKANMEKEQLKLEKSVKSTTQEYNKLVGQLEGVSSKVKSQNREYESTLQIIKTLRQNLNVDGGKLLNPNAVKDYTANVEVLKRQIDSLMNNQKIRDTGIATYVSDLEKMYNMLISKTKAFKSKDKNQIEFYQQLTTSIRNSIEAKKAEIIENGLVDESITRLLISKEKELALHQGEIKSKKADSQSAELERQAQQYDNIGVKLNKLNNGLAVFKVKQGTTFKPEEVERYTSTLDRLNTMYKNLDMTDSKMLTELQSQLKQAGVEWSNLIRDVNIYNAQMQKSSGFMKGFVMGSITSRIQMLPIQSFMESVKAVKELDSALNTLRITMDVTEIEMDKMVQGVRSSARELGTTYEEIMEVAKVYANANESIDSIMDKIRPTAILATVSGIGAEQATSTVQAVLNQFTSLEGSLKEKTQNIADVFIAVSRSLAMDFGKLCRLV